MEFPSTQRSSSSRWTFQKEFQPSKWILINKTKLHRRNTNQHILTFTKLCKCKGLKLMTPWKLYNSTISSLIMIKKKKMMKMNLKSLIKRKVANRSIIRNHKMPIRLSVMLTLPSSIIRNLDKKEKLKRLKPNYNLVLTSKQKEMKYWDNLLNLSQYLVTSRTTNIGITKLCFKNRLKKRKKMVAI